MKELDFRRKVYDRTLKVLMYLCAGITCALLIFLIGYIFYRGVGSVSWELLTTQSSYRNDTIGILPNILNTVYIILVSMVIVLPLGVGAAIYLTEYAKNRKLVAIIELATEILTGIPSIIFGLFGYAFFCIKFQWGYSILAGCFTMAICILPTIVRTTEEALLAVPEGYLEGAMSLGAPKLRVIFTILLPCAMPGILTAVILAMGRIVGETAALLFTVGVSGYRLPDEIFGHVMDQGCTLSLFLYNSAMNGKDPIGIPYATAAVLLILVFLLNRIAGLLARRLRKK